METSANSVVLDMEGVADVPSCEEEEVLSPSYDGNESCKGKKDHGKTFNQNNRNNQFHNRKDNFNNKSGTLGQNNSGKKNFGPTNLNERFKNGNTKSEPHNSSHNENKSNECSKNNNNGNKINNSNGNNGSNKVVVPSTKMEMLKSVFLFFHSEIVPYDFQPLNSWVFYLHYRFACLFFLAGFFIVMFNWYSNDHIICVSSFNAENHSKPFITNICLSYSSYELPSGRVKYILFYRWVHYAFLVVAFFFALPWMLMRRIGNPRVNVFLRELVNMGPSCEGSNYGNMKKKIVSYFEENLNTHRMVYVLFLFNHAFSTAICYLSVLFLNFILQGEFSELVLKTYPMSRDIVAFRDPLSRVFPPFVNCTIDQSSRMHSGRKELYYCHLTLMELYEKIFVFAWLLLHTLLLVGAVSTAILLLLPLPLFSHHLLRTSLRSDSLAQAKALLIRRLNFGDVFLLWLVKCYVSERQFSRVLEDLRVVVQERKKEGDGIGNELHPEKDPNHDVPHSLYVQNLIENYPQPLASDRTDSKA